MENKNHRTLPVLNTERLTLRQLSTNDGKEIFTLRSDIDVNKYLHRQLSITIEDAINFIEKVNMSISKNESFYWAITLTQTKNFVGTVCLFNILENKSSCEIGYELLKNFQGLGIMSEAVSSVIDFAFQTLKIKKIEACTHTLNLSSTKLLTKAGFEKSADAKTENIDFDLYLLASRNIE